MTDYSRGDYADLPAGKTDLENNYTAPDLTAIASNDNSTYANQTANNQIAIHQYKKTVTGQYTNITWSGKSNLAPSESPVIMEVYNVDDSAWEELDRDDSTAADTDFDLSYNNLATADYLDSGVITCRVWQDASAGGEITGLTAMASWSEIWSAASQTGASLTYVQMSAATRTYRQLIANAYISASATTIRIKFNQADPGYTDTIAMASCCIGEKDNVLEPLLYDFIATPTHVQKGGSNSFTIGYGSGFEDSDPIVIAIDETKDYIITFFQNNVAWRTAINDPLTGKNSVYKVGSDETETLHESGYTPDSSMFILATIEKDTSGYPFVYSASLTTEPTSVTENGNPLTNRGTIALTNSNAGSWHWESNTIYIRPTTLALDPPYMWS